MFRKIESTNLQTIQGAISSHCPLAISVCWWVAYGWADCSKTTWWTMYSTRRTRVSCRKHDWWKMNTRSICLHASTIKRSGTRVGLMWSIPSVPQWCSAHRVRVSPMPFEQLHQAADRERLCHVYLRLQVPRPFRNSLQSPASSLGCLQGKTAVLRDKFRWSEKVASVQSHQSRLYDGYIGRLRECLHHHAQP